MKDAYWSCGVNINLHIDRLVLDGIPMGSHQQSTLKASLSSELARILCRNGMAPDMHNEGTLKVMRTNSIDITEKNEPSHLGKQIAESIYGGLK